MEARRRGLTFGIILVALILAVVAAPASPTGAATAGITVLDSAAQNSFPQTLQFSVRAQSTSQVSSVRLAYRLGDEPATFIARATYAPGFRIVASYSIDLQHDYIPPGVIVHYQWQIQDMSGGELITTWSDLKLTDPRFLWHERTLGNVVLHWYEGDDNFADAVLASASKAFVVAQRDALAPWLGPVQVYLYGNEQDFRSAMGAGTADWTGGQTFGTLHVVVLLAPSNDSDMARRTVAHEINHAAIDGANSDPFGPLPSWLDEGMAMVAEGDPLAVFTDSLTKGIQTHSLMSLQSLSGSFPADPDRAILAYAESDSLVRYFISTYGRDRLAILIAAFHAGNDADSAFQTTVGVSALDFQRGWQASLGSKPAGSAARQPSAAGSPAPAQSTNFLSEIVRAFLSLFQSKKASTA